MGTTYVVTCSGCDYQFMYSTGVGMGYYSLEAIISCVARQRRDKVLDILRNHAVTQCEYEHRLYLCPKCHALAPRFYFHIAHDQNQVLETQFRCGNCRERLIAADDPFQADRWPCPTCGRKQLAVHEESRWD